MNAITRRFAVRTLLTLSCLLPTAVPHTASVFAAPPEVEFDAPALVAADDITTDEFRAARPGEKLIAVRLELSALVRRGEAGQLAEVLYRVEALDADMFVLDFGPKTTLEPLAEGNLSVERDADSQLRFDATARGRYFPFATADATVSKQVTEQSRLRYELPPPQELVVAAGTWQRQRGVFVKLRASRRDSLEGAKPLAVLFAVPQNWRGGVLRVEAEARSSVGGVLGSGDTASSSQVTFLAGVHVTGDVMARDAVERLIAATTTEQQRRAELARQGKTRLNRQVKHTFDDVATFFDGKHRSTTTKEQRAARHALEEAKKAQEKATSALIALNANPRD
jgi:hypothetical protein